MVLHADLAGRHVLVAHVLQWLPPGSLAFAVTLVLAQLRVVHPADARQELLLVCPGLLLRLAAGSLGDAPLGLPINPHVAELISGEKCLRVFPVEPVSTKYVICKFCQNGSSLGVPSQIF